MPSQRVDDHAQKENCDCNAVIEEVDTLNYGDDFGNSYKEIDVGEKDQYAYR